MTGASQVTEVAKGITDYGLTVVICAFFLILSAGMMIALFKWFRAIITQIMSDNKESMKGVLEETRKQNDLLNDLAEGLRSETLLRITNVAGAFFDLSIEHVCRLIKKIREENHISNKEATAEKIRKALKVIHDDRNAKFKSFSYRGTQLSAYCREEWIEQVAQVIETELYHEDGPNNKRAFTNVKLVYDDIRTDFYQRLIK